MAKKTTTRKTSRITDTDVETLQSPCQRLASKQADQTLPLSAEARRARLMATEVEPEVDVVPPARVPEPEVVEPTRRAGWKVEERAPLRPETPAQERQRYPTRLADHEQRLALWEERQALDYQREDIAHRRTCEVRQGCAHPAHVRKPRRWREAAKRDLRHLMGCVYPGNSPRAGQPIEDDRDCPERDDSHLLPPRPLDVRLEFCCEQRCYPKGTRQALTECLSIPVQVRTQRQAELRRNPKAFGDLASMGSGSASVLLLPSTLSESTLWASQAAGAIYDPANAPLRTPQD